MTYELMTVARCAELCGLRPQEIVLGVSPSAMHDSLYDSYLLQRHRKWACVRDMIVADLRMALDLGAKKRAADLLIVLRRFLSARRVVGEGVRVRSRAPAPREPRRTSAGVIELLCAIRNEAALQRSAPLTGNILSFDIARQRRRLATGRTR